MRLTKILIVILCIVVIYTFVNISLSLMDNREYARNQNFKYRTKHELSGTESVFKIDQANDKIFWFIQITDIHISKFKDHHRTDDLRRFCLENIPVVAPTLVIASGDLTDSKSVTGQDSMQYPIEWIAYDKVLTETGVLKITKWLDVRGNHDSFNVPHLHHADNLYKQYSIQGRQNLQSYMYTHRTHFGTYSFIALDVCPNPGPKRPYNFFGIVSSSTAKLLQHFTHLMRNDNLTMWFGHYPTSTIVAYGVDLRALIGRTAVAYMSGHLHTWGDLVPRMYTLQPQGFLELELGDWRDNRVYRIGAIDHDLFSFTDVRLTDGWPVVLITNPKHANYLLPHKEPVQRIAISTHIRILAWSSVSIKSVAVYLDGAHHGNAAPATSTDGPLFTIPWNPSLYAKSEGHVIRVEVEDVDGRRRTVEQPFTVTGTPLWQFGYGAALLLLGDQAHNVRVFYYTLWATLFLLLICARLARYRLNVLCAYTDHPLLLAFYRLANHDRLFYCLVFYLLYSACGPLMMGIIIDRHFGVVFLYGVYVANTYIPEAFTYVSEFCQNLTFIVPLIIYLCRRIMLNSTSTAASSPRSSSMLGLLRARWGFLLLCVWQLYYTIMSVFLPYGFVTTLLSPCRLWLIPMALFMLTGVQHTPKIVLQQRQSSSTSGETVANGIHPVMSFADLVYSSPTGTDRAATNGVSGHCN